MGGRERLHWFTECQIDLLQNQLQDYRDNGKKLFKLPEDITGHNKVTWKGATSRDSIVLDLQTEKETVAMKESHWTENFRTALDIWEERPKITAYRKTGYVSWYSSVH